MNYNRKNHGPDQTNLENRLLDFGKSTPPRKRAMRPEKIANAIIDRLIRKSDWLNGDEIVVNKAPIKIKNNEIH